MNGNVDSISIRSHGAMAVLVRNHYLGDLLLPQSPLTHALTGRRRFRFLDSAKANSKEPG